MISGSEIEIGHIGAAARDAVMMLSIKQLPPGLVERFIGIRHAQHIGKGGKLFRCNNGVFSIAVACFQIEARQLAAFVVLRHIAGGRRYVQPLLLVLLLNMHKILLTAIGVELHPGNEAVEHAATAHHPCRRRFFVHRIEPEIKLNAFDLLLLLFQEVRHHPAGHDLRFVGHPAAGIAKAVAHLSRQQPGSVGRLCKIQIGQAGHLHIAGRAVVGPFPCRADKFGLCQYLRQLYDMPENIPRLVGTRVIAHDIFMKKPAVQQVTHKGLAGYGRFVGLIVAPTGFGPPLLYELPHERAILRM